MKWPRSQKFQLSETGLEAGANYREVIVAARTETGRKSFDAARAEWAARRMLEAADGLYLGELQSGPKTLEEIAASLDGLAERGDIRKAVERLVKLRLVELIVPPPPPPP